MIKNAIRYGHDYKHEKDRHGRSVLPFSQLKLTSLDLQDAELIGFLSGIDIESHPDVERAIEEERNALFDSFIANT